ncbi:MAG: methionyl-tRNA formyltransferase [Acidobacteriota bacterium]
MKIDEGMDTGDILSQVTITVGENVTGGELEDILAHKGAELLIQTIPPYARGDKQPQPQDTKRATYAPRITKQEAEIDWNRSAPEIHNWIRALDPWPTAWTSFGDKKVKIWRSEKVGEPVRDLSPLGRPGAILGLGKDRIVVECGGKTFLSLGELQLPNRARISARDFVNGVNPRVGDLFS